MFAVRQWHVYFLIGEYSFNVISVYRLSEQVQSCRYTCTVSVLRDACHRLLQRCYIAGCLYVGMYGCKITIRKTITVHRLYRSIYYRLRS